MLIEREREVEGWRKERREDAQVMFGIPVNFISLLIDC